MAGDKGHKIIRETEFPTARNDAGGLYTRRFREVEFADGTCQVQTFYDAPWQVGGSHRWEPVGVDWEAVEAEKAECLRRFGLDH